MDLDTFEVVAAAVHDVPPGGSGDDPRLTEAEIPLDDSLRSYFRSKIVRSLGMRGVDVIADPDGVEVAREAVARVLADPSELVPESRRVAEHRHGIQTGRNSAGLLTFVLGELDARPCVCVMKLEREQGLRFNITAGRNTVDLELLRQLTLTDKTKVFKTSLLRCASGGSAADVHGRVSDDQRGRKDGVGVASFYLSDFLGCQLRESPAKQTMTFARAAESFINDSVVNPHTQGSYQLAVLAELQSNTMDLRPRDFAQTHLQQADRAGFMQAIRDAGMDPGAAFEKDVSLVKVTKFRIDFEHGIVLVGPTGAMDRHVHLRDADSDVPGAEVNDAVKRLGGR